MIHPASGNPAKQLVIFLHGLGADGQDLISLSQFFAEELPDAMFISPNAPFPCDMAPYGYQWFSMQNRSPQVMFEGIRKAAPVLNHFIDTQLAALNLLDKDLMMIGFSQGTMTGLHVALRRLNPCAAFVGFSGALLGEETLSAEIKSRPPVCLIHGDRDEVVPFAAMGRAEAALKRADVPVETHTRPYLSHGIDPEGIETAVKFIRRNLN